ncbi:hypothetical protein GCM10009788_34710 [Nocardioides humi]|uniref:VOC domain-containing protein n=1 Tax=Nocardioides humi TaxID=449461 RepID=A0ABN2AVI3_9ACTN
MLTGIRQIKLPVGDLQVSVRWYARVLGLRLVAELADPDGTLVRIVTPPQAGPFVGVVSGPDGSPSFYDTPRLRVDP